MTAPKRAATTARKIPMTARPKITRKCEACRADMIRNPFPGTDKRSALCIECDFHPETLKTLTRAFSFHFPEATAPKAAPSLKKTKLFFGSKKNRNPYLADVLALVDGDELPFRDRIGFSQALPHAILLALARDRYIFKYAWAIPCQEALETIASYSPIVEIAAGSGYWAHLLTKMGADILAYDASVPRPSKKPSLPRRRYWFDVRKGNEESLKRHSDRALFLCWPPHKDPMAVNALKHYEGDTVLYIGEKRDGCTASDAFFRLLEKRFSLERTVELPVWPGMHDRLQVFKRRK